MYVQRIWCYRSPTADKVTYLAIKICNIDNYLGLLEGKIYLGEFNGSTS